MRINVVSYSHAGYTMTRITIRTIYRHTIVSLARSSAILSFFLHENVLSFRSSCHCLRVTTFFSYFSGLFRLELTSIASLFLRVPLSPLPTPSPSSWFLSLSRDHFYTKPVLFFTKFYICRISYTAVSRELFFLLRWESHAEEARDA